MFLRLLICYCSRAFVLVRISVNVCVHNMHFMCA